MDSRISSQNLVNAASCAAFLAGLFVILSVVINWTGKGSAENVKLLDFPTTLIDAGVRGRTNKALNFEFEMSNTTGSTVYITSLAGDCGCTVAESVQELSANETSKINVSVTPNPGFQKYRILLRARQGTVFGSNKYQTQEFVISLRTIKKNEVLIDPEAIFLDGLVAGKHFELNREIKVLGSDLLPVDVVSLGSIGWLQIEFANESDHTKLKFSGTAPETSGVLEPKVELVHEKGSTKLPLVVSIAP